MNDLRILHYRGVTVFAGCRPNGQRWEGTAVFRFGTQRVEHVCLPTRDAPELALDDAWEDALQLARAFSPEVNE